MYKLSFSTSIENQIIEILDERIERLKPNSFAEWGTERSNQIV